MFVGLLTAGERRNELNRTYTCKLNKPHNGHVIYQVLIVIPVL